MSYGIMPRVGTLGSFQEKSKGYSTGALQARAAMQPGSRSVSETEAPGKTVGGGIIAGMGGAAGGAGVALALGLASNPAGWAIAGAAALGMTAYYLS